MIEFVDDSDIWKDFSISTPFEKIIAEIEAILQEWSKNTPKESQNKEIIFREKVTFKIVYVKKEDVSIDLHLYDFDYRNDNILFVNNIFGLNEDFVFVNVIQLNKVNQETVKSIIKCAMEPNETFFPVIAKCNESYIGFKISKSCLSYFNSKEYIDLPPGFRTVSETIDLICSSFRQCNNLCTSRKTVYRLTMGSYLNMSTSYYYIHRGEFIEKIDLEVIYDKKSDLKYCGLRDFSNACLYVTFRSLERKSKSVLSEFQTMLERNSDISFPNSKIYNDDESITNEVKSIFRKGHKLEEYTIPFKSCNPRSLLTDFFIYILHLENVETLYLYWRAFVANIRSHYDKKIIIPNIEEYGSNYERSVRIDQSLQIINYCIEFSKNRFAIKKGNNINIEDTVIQNVPNIPERFKDVNVDINRRKVAQDIASFKFFNEKSTYESFHKWYQSKDDHREIWNNTTPCHPEKQKPIFNIENIAQFELDYLENLELSEFITSLILAIFGNIYDRLIRKTDRLYCVYDYILDFGGYVSKEVEKIETQDYKEKLKTFGKLINKVNKLSYKLGCFKSLRKKFKSSYLLINNILINGFSIVYNNERDNVISFIDETNLNEEHIILEDTLFTWKDRHNMRQRLVISKGTQTTCVSLVHTELR